MSTRRNHTVAAAGSSRERRATRRAAPTLQKQPARALQTVLTNAVRARLEHLIDRIDRDPVFLKDVAQDEQQDLLRIGAGFSQEIIAILCAHSIQHAAATASPLTTCVCRRRGISRCDDT
jgi:hypothetical protein